MKSDKKYILVVFGLLILIGVFARLINLNIIDYQYLKNSFANNPIQTQIEKIVHSPVPTTELEKPIRLLFAGDMMWDRNIRLMGEKFGYDFILGSMTDYLNTYDLVIANLETPVTDNQSRSVGSAIGSTNNYIFTTNPLALKFLTKNNINLVNIGNNHIGNFGENGYLETISNLNDNEISYFGVVPYPQEQSFAIVEFDGIKIGLVNYNQFVTDGYEKALLDLDLIKTKGVDLIVLYTHWDNEYQPNPAKVTVDRAHAFIDAGVDVIIGSHPHVVQSIEEYKGKMIYYSLGNFVFDQYFSKETMEGLLVEMEINRNDLSTQYKTYKSLTERSGKTILID